MSLGLNERFEDPGGSDAARTARAHAWDDAMSNDVAAVLTALVASAGPDGVPPTPILQGLADACLLTSATGQIRAANRAAAAMLAPFGSAPLVGCLVTDLARDGGRTTLDDLLTGTGDLRQVSFVEVGVGDGPAVMTTIAATTLPDGDRLWLLRPDADDEGDPALARMWRHVPVAGYTCRVERGWPCLQVTPTLVDLLGDAPDAWVARPQLWLERVHADDRERLVVEREQARVERRHLDTVYRIRDLHGEYTWVHDAAWFEFRGDEPVRAHGVLIDVTNRQEAGALLESLHEQGRDELVDVRRQLARRTTLLRVLAHDVRTPLAGASGWIETMLRDDIALDDAVARDMLGRAREDLQRLAMLVQEVLESQRMHAGPRRTAVADAVDVDAVVDEAVRRGTPTGATVEVHGSAVARVDAFVVGRVVANLVERACRRSPEPDAVQVHLVRQEDVLVIGVDDGEPPPAATVPTPTTDDDLSLAIVDELVRGQGGSVTVRAGTRGGTLVEARLPERP